MSDKTNWKKIYDYCMVIFYALIIAVTSGFGILFLLITWAKAPVIEAIFWSFILSTGLAMIFLMSEVQNKRRKYGGEEEAVVD